MLKCLAPVNAKRWASSLIFVMMIVVGAAVLREILAFRSFQISRETSIKIEAMDILLRPAALTTFRRQAQTESSCYQDIGE